MEAKTNKIPIPDFPQARQASRFMNPFTDMGFKRIFGQEANKDLLLDFLNELLDGEDRIADVQFLDKEIIRGNEQNRGIIYDVFCRTADGKYLIIEMQASSQKGYRERAIYYSGKALSRQGTPGKGWDFDQLAAVYSINFLNFDFIEDRMRLGIAQAGKVLGSALGFHYLCPVGEVPFGHPSDGSGHPAGLQHQAAVHLPGVPALPQEGAGVQDRF